MNRAFRIPADLMEDDDPTIEMELTPDQLEVLTRAAEAEAASTPQAAPPASAPASAGHTSLPHPVPAAARAPLFGPAPTAARTPLPGRAPAAVRDPLPSPVPAAVRPLPSPAPAAVRGTPEQDPVALPGPADVRSVAAPTPVPSTVPAAVRVVAERTTIPVPPPSTPFADEPAALVPVPATGRRAEGLAPRGPARWRRVSYLAVGLGIVGLCALAAGVAYLRTPTPTATPSPTPVNPPSPVESAPLPAGPALPADPVSPSDETPQIMRVVFPNPFDATEVFEFPPGTTQREAREAVADLLLKRARERLKPSSNAKDRPRRGDESRAETRRSRLARRG